MLGGDLETWEASGALHSPGTEQAIIILTLSKGHSAMLQFLFYYTPKIYTACTSMLANMHLGWHSPRCKIRQRRYCIISAINYTIHRGNTLHMTDNY